MRYFVIDDDPLSLDQIEAGLREVDPSFQVTPTGELRRGDQLLAELAAHVEGSEAFSDELDGFLDLVGDTDPDPRSEVERQLEKTRAIVAAQLLWQDRSLEQTIELLAPLWLWLRKSRAGLFQADHEGFYDGDELILELP